MKEYQTTQQAVERFQTKFHDKNAVIEKKIESLTERKNSIIGKIKSLTDEYVEADIANETKSKTQLDKQINELLNEEKTIIFKIEAFGKILNDSTRDNKNGFKIKTLALNELKNIEKAEQQNHVKTKQLKEDIKAKEKQINELNNENATLNHSSSQVIKEFWKISKYLYEIKEPKSHIPSYEHGYVKKVMSYDKGPKSMELEEAFNRLGILCK